MAFHAMDRHRQGDPRGRQGKIRRRARGHRGAAHLRSHVRSRHRLSCDRRLSSDPDLLRQSARGERFRSDRLHHRRPRRHGVGSGCVDLRSVRRRGGKPVEPLSRGIIGSDRHFPHFHPRPAVAPERPVRSAGVSGMAPILWAVALLAMVPALTTSNVVLNFLIAALLIALVGQGWNVLGGYGGQYSFGHSAFFGTGAYVTAILQVHYGVNAWIGFVIGIAAGALVGTIIGALAFRSGLRGSYFALVTLAFAEVLRILASVAPITGAGVGTLIPLNLRPEAFQFQSRAPFYWIALALVAISLLIVHLIEQ